MVSRLQRSSPDSYPSVNAPVIGVSVTEWKLSRPERTPPERTTMLPSQEHADHTSPVSALPDVPPGRHEKPGSTNAAHATSDTIREQASTARCSHTCSSVNGRVRLDNRATQEDKTGDDSQLDHRRPSRQSRVI